MMETNSCGYGNCKDAECDSCKHNKIVPDREKVIKELDYWRKMVGDYRLEIVIDDAITLLKEQDAAAIVWKCGFPHCPVCGQMLPEGDAVKYCLHCGRSVKWE